MAALKPEFVEGCRASGTSTEVIEFLWQTNEKSADYSFNKSHAACYGLIAYRTAWLKANHTAEYMAALISSVMSTKDKVPFFVARCEEMGIEILPPDVNLSDHEFTVGAGGGEEGAIGNIRFGLDAVKGVGYQAVEAIKRAREGSPAARAFTSLWDFCERVDSRAVNKKAIEALIKCGAFGSTGATRKGMLAVLEKAQAAGQKTQQDAQIGQGSIFDLQADAPGGARSDSADALAALAQAGHPPIPTEEFEQAELLAVEKEAIGLFVSAHPLKPLRDALRARVDCPLAALDGSPRQGLGDGRRDHHRGQAHPHAQRRPHDVRDARRPRGRGRGARVRQGAGRARGRAARVDEVALGDRAEVVDHKEAGKTCVVVQSVEEFAPCEEEIEQRAGAGQARAPPRPPPRSPSRVHLRVAAAALPRGRDRRAQADDRGIAAARPR